MPSSKIIIVVLLLLTGCTRNDRPAMAPVHGQVLYNGAPVEGARVTFTPQGGGRPSIGLTDADGWFRLQSFRKGDGAVVGHHLVLISKTERPIPPPGGTAGLDEDDFNALFRSEAEREAYYSPRQLLPRRYSDRQQTPLEAEVQAKGKNEFTFELTD